MRKLPHGLRIVISRKITDDQWNLDSILEALLDEIDARERAGISSFNRTRQDRDLPTGTTLTTNTSLGANAQPNSSSSCSYCYESHSPTQCQTASLVEDRKRILRRQGKCFNCLRKGHLGRDWKSQSSCRECKCRHHTSICHKTRNPLGQANSVNLQVNTSVLNPDAPSFSPPSYLIPIESKSSHSSIFYNQSILLQTAHTIVFNANDRDNNERVRIILDCGILYPR